MPSAARCSPRCSASTARCRSIDYEAERAAVGIVHDAIARGVLRSCRAIRDGGMLVALARLAFDAMRAGRTIGAEIDFGNPFCEAGGFLCEVSDDSGDRRDRRAARRRDDDAAELVVNGTRFRRRATVRDLVAAAGGALSMSARIAVLVFPGTNSEDETLRLLRDCGGDAELVHWSQRRVAAGRTMRTCFPAASRTRTAFAPARSPRTTV